MTTLLPGPRHSIVVDRGVYTPQVDSQLLIDTMERTAVVVGRRVLDLCTGSGVLAVAAAQLGAAEVHAWDIDLRAVRCAQANADAADANVHVTRGSIGHALQKGPYEVVICNPPYVPTPRTSHSEFIAATAGPAWAWDAGEDGREFLDPLCAAAPELLSDGGSILVVHSEFANADQTIRALQDGGLTAKVVAQQSIPFGPVLSARAQWLEGTGRLERGRRTEELIVVRADK